MTYQSVNRNSTIVKYCHDSSKTITSRFIQKLIYYKNNPELKKKKTFSWCQKLRFSETIISLKLRCLMPLSAITLFVRGDSCLQSTYPCLSLVSSLFTGPENISPVFRPNLMLQRATKSCSSVQKCIKTKINYVVCLSALMQK